MHLCFILVICTVIPGSLVISVDDELRRLALEEDPFLELPEGFTVGAGGSSYQTEGGWNASDKGESTWDRFVHTKPWKIADRSNGDVACDSYHKYKEDVQWIKELGLGHYRFSISWTRVLPNGFADSISQEGLRYYHNLIDELLANDIEPLVLLYHWDHPQVLEDFGGWTNESMVTWFADYANVIFRELGPKVKVFTTVNEPNIFCDLAYVIGFHAPGKTLTSSDSHMCVHNLLKAHARAYHLYDQRYRPTQKGKIGIAAMCSSFLPKTPNETLAAEIAFQFECGRIAHPIYRGDYPDIFKTKMSEVSRAAGLSESVLPSFSKEWIEYINGTSDYFGLIHYTSLLVEFGPRSELHDRDNLPAYLGIRTSYDPSWEWALTGWLHIVPEGMGNVLRKIKHHYNNPPVYILENGSADGGTLNDYGRIKYHHSYLKELLLAVHRDGCNVRKYTIWSLLDNFEWGQGYEGKKYGLIQVNFSSPDRERVPKLSVSWVKNVTRTRRLQPPILPSSNSTVDL